MYPERPWQTRAAPSWSWWISVLRNLAGVNPIPQPPHGILLAFGRRTGYPVLQSKSFNRAGEPIVTTPHDAVECFLGTGMDALVLGPYVMVKGPDGELSQVAD